MRKVFLHRVSDMIRNERDTVFFTVDIGMWAIRDVLHDFPERCSNVGVFEDGLFSIVAGMASRGFVPTIFGIQPYLIERTLEQIKMDFAYPELGINVVGTGAAVDYSKYGYSHYCAEDVSLIKLIPGVDFIAPGTAAEFLQLFNQVYRNGRPSFFRISDHPNRMFDFAVSYGKANIIKTGKTATVIAVSIMLDSVMEACVDKDVTVLYYTTLEPFDYVTLAENCSTGKVLIVEPEFKGSFLYDIHEALPNRMLQIEQISFPREIFRNYGTYDDKIQFYNLTATAIRNKLDKLLEC